MSRWPPAATLALVAALLAGCGGGGSSATLPPGVRTPPDLATFLRQPVATPSDCPSQPAQSTGLRSPWRGHVDVSVFLRPRAAAGVVDRIGRELRHAHAVERVYFESKHEAYAEFQRLYSCWADVARSQTPASYRVVLAPTATIVQRNALVARMVQRTGVDSVSCDPSLPCTSVVQSAAADQRR
ncbi:MAG TPA: permease-like cell division protein FtsX [Mycobacteriales bacterium]|nr:permease-like cell division protein FtsX [Mycobacteriales bacterium]